jgi:two-component system, LytTR family, sensor kinase
MKEPSFIFFVILILCSSMMLMAGLFILSKFHRLFTRNIKNELLRQNVVTWMVAICLTLAVSPLSGEFYSALGKKGLLYAIWLQFSFATVSVIFVFNVTRVVARLPAVLKMSFIKQKTVVLIAIILSTIAICLPLNYIFNDYSTKHFKFAVLFSFYNGLAVGLIYITMSYIDVERKRKLDEKELELVKLNELKTKAELDALHSKVNPHFLYNALNSIADLSITDGKKARRMTIALADLFRYSINYSHNNYSTVNDEVAMTDVYLQIEKIRFEDQLNYSVNVDDDTGHYLVPRFILQPLVENAVKHGLKVTGQMTEIFLEVKKKEDGLVIYIADNGPAFPDELTPGYGVKSVFDKMDLLFPGQYEIYFSNHPRKQVSIHIHKLVKNESGL